jgi:hypothetical protein
MPAQQYRRDGSVCRGAVRCRGPTFCFLALIKRVPLREVFLAANKQRGDFLLNIYAGEFSHWTKLCRYSDMIVSTLSRRCALIPTFDMAE